MGLKIPDTITLEEFEKIIKITKKLKMKTAFKFAFWEGLRVSEVINLKPQDINIQTGFIHVKKGKGNKDRDIPLFPEVIHSVRYLPVGVSRQALHKAIKNKGKKALNKDIHFHTLRHSGASYYLNERRVDIKYIQDLLGHTRLSTTQIYLHVNPQQLKNAFENARR